MIAYGIYAKDKIIVFDIIDSIEYTLKIRPESKKFSKINFATKYDITTNNKYGTVCFSFVIH